jgi:hypothetical protein
MAPEKPQGRPRQPVSAELARVLTETYYNQSAWTEDISETSRNDLAETLRQGKLIATHRGLSFRCRITRDNLGTTLLTMWLQTKRRYVRRGAS